MILRARAEAVIVRDSSASPWTASWRRAASSEAISSDDGDVERTSRTARATASGSMRPVGATCSIADCVSEPTILCVEVSTASAPCCERGRRQVGVEAEVRAPRLVDDERHAGGVRDRGAAGDVGGHAVVGRRDDERGARAGRRASARSSASGVTPCAMPSSSSYSGATKLGRPPESTSPSITDACELRCTTTGAPSGASARQSAWLPCVAPLVRNHVRAAPCASAASCSARSYGVGSGPRSMP